jgi:carbamate kinase
MLVVVALGGNALIRRGQSMDVTVQRANVELAVGAIVELAREHDVVVTHGNGPQVGLLALQAEAHSEVAPYPLDVLGAESEGMIGYLLDQELVNRLGGGRQVATLLTQLIVDAEDPAFHRPEKFIGPVYDDVQARQLAGERDWTMAADGRYWRRVVASPEPRGIVELGTIRLLIDAGVLVVCVGGGGIPVVVDRDGRLRGVEAVVDKDRAAALLAEGLRADALLMLTDVPAVELDHGTPAARALGDVDAAELAELMFAPGSMGPKVEAACRFADRTGGLAAIGALEDAAAILRGERGTRVRATRTSGTPSGSTGAPYAGPARGR